MTRARKGAALAVAPGEIGLVEYIPGLARGFADKRRPVKEPLTWSAALDAAPWSGKLPAAWEAPFRRAYAERLVERGLALPAAKAGTTSGKGGKTDLVRLPSVYLSADELASVKERAHRDGLTVSAWVRRRCAEP